MAAHAWNPSTQEDGKFKVTMGYIAKSCLKKIKNK
jgi:hypothetical protein